MGSVLEPKHQLIDRPLTDRIDAHPCGFGVDGAAYIPPWALFTPRQFWDHSGATRGTHLASPFGNWWRNIPASPPGRPPRKPAFGFDPFARESRQQRKERRARAAAKAAGRAARRVGLDEENRRREVEAGRDIEALLEVARPIYRAIAAESSRPPGRDRLREAMVAAGHPCDEWGARALVAALRAGPDPGGASR